jgi:hypothetical protein
MKGSELTAFFQRLEQNGILGANAAPSQLPLVDGDAAAAMPAVALVDPRATPLPLDTGDEPSAPASAVAQQPVPRPTPVPPTVAAVPTSSAPSSASAQPRQERSNPLEVRATAEREHALAKQNDPHSQLKALDRSFDEAYRRAETLGPGPLATLRTTHEQARELAADYSRAVAALDRAFSDPRATDGAKLALDNGRAAKRGQALGAVAALRTLVDRLNTFPQVASGPTPPSASASQPLQQGAASASASSPASVAQPSPAPVQQQPAVVRQQPAAPPRQAAPIDPAECRYEITRKKESAGRDIRTQLDAAAGFENHLSWGHDGKFKDNVLAPVKDALTGLLKDPKNPWSGVTDDTLALATRGIPTAEKVRRDLDTQEEHYMQSQAKERKGLFGGTKEESPADKAKREDKIKLIQGQKKALDLIVGDLKGVVEASTDLAVAEAKADRPLAKRAPEGTDHTDYLVVRSEANPLQGVEKTSTLETALKAYQKARLDKSDVAAEGKKALLNQIILAAQQLLPANSANAVAVGHLRGVIQSAEADKNRIGDKHKDGLALGTVMSDPLWNAGFAAFCKTEFSPENHEFLAAARRGVKGTTQADVQAIYALYDRYISENAAQQVNLPSSTRDDVTQALFRNGQKRLQPDGQWRTNIPDNDADLVQIRQALNNAHAAIFNMVENDSFRRFVAIVLVDAGLQSGDKDTKEPAENFRKTTAYKALMVELQKLRKS